MLQKIFEFDVWDQDKKSQMVYDGNFRKVASHRTIEGRVLLILGQSRNRGKGHIAMKVPWARVLTSFE